MKRFLLGLGAALILLVAGAWLMRGEIAVRMMGRIYDRAMTASPSDGLPDGLHVALCGSGSPMPDPSRAGPCTAVLAGQRLFVFDAGAGSVRNLSLTGLSPFRVERVFLTHFHSDHIDGLGELMLQRWAGSGATAPLLVHGPKGVETVVSGLMTAYGPDRNYRIAHHGEAVTPPAGFGGQAVPFDALSGADDVILIDEPDLRIRAFPVDHAPVSPAVGYIIEYKGRKAVISGDTDISPNVERAARGADLLIHEGLSLRLVGIQQAAASKAGKANLAKILGARYSAFERIVTSVSAARARSAPTVASFLSICSNRSTSNQLAAFSWVILLISSSVQRASTRCSQSSSGEPGKVQSEWG